MKTCFWVIVTREGFDRATKREPPALKAGEFAFPFELEVPDAIFRPPAMPVIRFSVPAPPAFIEAEIVEEPIPLPEHRGSMDPWHNRAP